MTQAGLDEPGEGRREMGCACRIHSLFGCECCIDRKIYFGTRHRHKGGRQRQPLGSTLYLEHSRFGSLRSPGIFLLLCAL